MSHSDLLRLAGHAEAIVRGQTRRECRIEIDDLWERIYLLEDEIERLVVEKGLLQQDNRRLLDALMGLLPMAKRAAE